MSEEHQYTIEGPDGSTDSVALPEGLVAMFNDADDAPAQVVGDLVLVAFSQRIHAIVHHSEDDVDDDLEALESQTLDTFEERFGRSFEDVTGHQH